MNKKWTVQSILEDAKKYKTRSEWKRLSKSAYQQAVSRRILAKACQHMTLQLKKWTKKAILQDAKKYKTRSEWKTNSGSAYNAARTKKIFDQAVAHMKPIPNRWTEEAIFEDAKKYNSKKEWLAHSPSAYAAAKKKNISDQIFSKMGGNIRWTEKTILEDAKKYKTRKEWELNSSGYSAALKKNIVDKACLHMKKSNNISTLESELFQLIKTIFPKAQTLRDTKVSIPGKPHIKGFHIDIYIPELRKGIEFNGKYWHSVEGLKRGRPDWPKEDLEKYHELKNNYFENKKIKILHVSESEWLQNRKACISAVLNFLTQKRGQNR